ncbi:MAG: phospholipase D family protein, partial [Bacteroidetes bacterium]|nr:phospholipase D family protein [Bacteroidota bacterium]
IKIAVFQIHLDSLFDLLEQKLNEGINIDILTLPYDSINDSVSADVITRFEALSNLGAHINFCKWNVGDPERTSTAIGRWYSFHGKFIVTDKSAIALSANFTRNNELDAIIVIENEQLFIDQFNERFDELMNLFVTENDGFEGVIRNNIINSGLANINEVFELPNVIQTTTHQNTWIKHYPSTLCPDDIELEENLYITPFSIKGRNVYEKILNDAEEFIYLSAESFTDVDFGMFMRQLKIKKILIFACLLVLPVWIFLIEYKKCFVN